jgi:CxxC motif-containing protein (DUF1111 family)
MTTTHIVCPGCGARLKTKAPWARGNVGRCPECKTQIVAEAPTETPPTRSGLRTVAASPRIRRLVRKAATIAAAMLCAGVATWVVWDLVGNSRRAEARDALVSAPAPLAPAPIAKASPTPLASLPAKIDPDSRAAKVVREALRTLESLAHRPKAPESRQLAKGKELFLREWLANDPRSHGGDGLGPVFNDSSCVACHNLGGPGGGGPTGKNVDIITAATNRAPNAIAAAQSICAPSRPLDESISEGDLARVAPSELKAAQAELEELAKIHVGFRHALSVVLHRSGTDTEYDTWRLETLGSPQGGDMGQAPRRTGRRRSAPPSLDQQARMEIQRLRQQSAAPAPRMGATQLQSRRSSGSTVLRSQRNTPALFGAGLIDAISDDTLRASAAKQDRDFPEIHGRLPLKRDGSVGRFGWKAQTGHLEEFVLTACAVEVGLEVPGHHQGSVPHDPDYDAPGLDMDQDESDALVAYVRSLAKPVEPRPSRSEDAFVIEAGRSVFASVGCAVCHSPNLGQVRGLYSDLLLHDMGAELGDVGQYGVFAPESPSQDSRSPGLLSPKAKNAGEVARGASRLEWRTPPLWGLRDSGPYLHDGRAETIDQAIALHGGEGERSALRYFSRTPTERQQLIAFLRSLTAPSETESVRAATMGREE